MSVLHQTQVAISCSRSSPSSGALGGEDTDLPFPGADQHIHSVDFMYLKLRLLMVLPEDEKNEGHTLHSTVKMPDVNTVILLKTIYCWVLPNVTVVWLALVAQTIFCLF